MGILSYLIFTKLFIFRLLQFGSNPPPAPTTSFLPIAPSGHGVIAPISCSSGAVGGSGGVHSGSVVNSAPTLTVNSAPPAPPTESEVNPAPTVNSAPTESEVNSAPLVNYAPDSTESEDLCNVRVGSNQIPIDLTAQPPVPPVEEQVPHEVHLVSTFSHLLDELYQTIYSFTDPTVEMTDNEKGISLVTISEM